jgi:Ca2+-binding RTX toxin-like protein
MFAEISRPIFGSIDTRTNKESKQTEGYGTFRDLVDGLAPDSPENLIRSADDGVINTDTLNLEINGGEGFDQIFGGVDDEHLFGGGGSDFLKGGGGNDTLDGGDGDDFVFADAGNDTVKGGEGKDTIMFDELTTVGNQLVIDLFKDVSAQAANDDLGTNTISSIENVIGTSSVDLIDGNGYDNVIDGAGGDDVIKGGRGDDTLFGGDGADMLYGGRGEDILEGGKGNDTLSGGAGRDTFVFTLADDDGINLLAGGDSDTVINFNHHAKEAVQVDGLTGTQSVHLSSGKLFVTDNSNDGNVMYDEYNESHLLLAEGFKTYLTDSHLDEFLTTTYLPEIA